MLRDGVMIMIALMFGGCFGVVVTCCMVTAKRSDQELGDMMKEKREGTVMPVSYTHLTLPTKRIV